MVSVDWNKMKKNTETLGRWMYWIVGILILGTISYILYTRFNKQVAAILVFLISMMALYYYYVKWIVIGNEFQPPVSTCPDFMTNLGLYGNEKQFVCVDLNGIYKPNTVATSTNKSDYSFTDSNGSGVVDTTKGVVDTTKGAVLTPKLDVSEGDKKTFCSNLKTAGISWIGFCEV